MALSPQLLQFKSSGVYRLEFDKSQTTNFATETIRLVVGHSKKGPYNTPVFIQTVEDFRNKVPLTKYENYAETLLNKRSDELPSEPLDWVQTT